MKAAIATGATAKGGFILPYNRSSRTEESHCHSWKKKTVFPNPNSYLPKPPRLLLLVCATANGTNTSTNELGLGGGGGAKGSGTTARGRRLLKIREEKRKREHDRLHNYPAWAKQCSLSVLLFHIYYLLICYVFPVACWVSLLPSFSQSVGRRLQRRC